MRKSLKVLVTMGLMSMMCSSIGFAAPGKVEPENAKNSDDKAFFYSSKVENFATNRHGSVSGQFENYVPKNAVDGDTNTFWAVKAAGKQEYILVDLGQAKTVDATTIKWSLTNYPKKLTIQTSTNGSSWQTVKTIAGQGGVQAIKLTATSARYVKYSFTESNSAYFTVYELGIYNNGSNNNDNNDNNNNNNNNGNSKSFIVTSVKDNLDANDATIMSNNLTELGYSKLLYNSNTSTADLDSYLKRQDVGIVYHTGHGAEGYVATSNGGLTVTKSPISAQNVFFATCLTLKETSLKQMMQPTCKNVFGYTNYSYDIADDTVVEKMTAAIKEGKSMPASWYIANAAVSSLRDRWCNYSRQGNQIVEYSARSSSNPTYAGEWKQLGNAVNIKVNPKLLTDTRNFVKEFSYIKSNVVTVKASKETNSNSSYGKEPLIDQLQSKEQAVQTAEQWMKSNNSQKDFKMDTISPIERKVNGDGKTIGYIVSYVRTINGLKVKNNINEENVTLIVNGNKVTTFTKRINENDTISSRTYENTQILPVNEALNKAAAAISRLIKTPNYKIAGIEPCFSYSKSKLIPAYQVIDDSGSSLIISAFTGEVILK